MRHRRLGTIVVAALLLIAATRHPTANIRILTSDQSDLTPHRFEAAADLGVIGVSILVTWTARHLADG